MGAERPDGTPYRTFHITPTGGGPGATCPRPALSHHPWPRAKARKAMFTGVTLQLKLRLFTTVRRMLPANADRIASPYCRLPPSVYLSQHIALLIG